MELTFFGQIAATALLFAAMIATFPLFMFLADFLEEMIDWVGYFIGFFVWLVSFLAIAMCIPMVWGAGFGGMGG